LKLAWSIPMMSSRGRRRPCSFIFWRRSISAGGQHKISCLRMTSKTWRTVSLVWYWQYI
jgi:hypothetical protein